MAGPDLSQNARLGVREARAGGEKNFENCFEFGLPSGILNVRERGNFALRTKRKQMNIEKTESGVSAKEKTYYFTCDAWHVVRGVLYDN